MTELFDAIKFALWKQECDNLKNANWKDVLGEAQGHAVLGLALNAMEHFVSQTDDKMLLFDNIVLIEKIKWANNRTNICMCNLIDILQKRNIDYRVFKGQVVATCYPCPEIRQSGDIDIWVPKEHQKECLVIIEQSLSHKIKRYGSEIHIEFEWQGVPIELHQRLTSFVWKKHQDYFNYLLEKDEGMTVVVEGKGIKTMSPTLNALYIFIHFFFHLVTEGVGLRQLCDWMMWLHKYKDVINRSELEDNLGKLGLSYAYQVMGAILVDKLGLPEVEFPIDINEKARKKGNSVLNDIMANGNFGQKKTVIHNVGFLHSCQTFCKMVSQGVKHANLAPLEVPFYIPQRFFWYYRKLLLKNGGVGR